MSYGITGTCLVHVSLVPPPTDPSHLLPTCCTRVCVCLETNDGKKGLRPHHRAAGDECRPRRIRVAQRWAGVSRARRRVGRGLSAPQPKVINPVCGVRMCCCCCSTYLSLVWSGVLSACLSLPSPPPSHPPGPLPAIRLRLRVFLNNLKSKP